MNPGFLIRTMQSDDRDAVAGLIHRSTKTWYREKLNREIFGEDPAACGIFADVYETLDPGCCLLAVDPDSGVLRASCFYHPRETHWSLGIMNSAPDPGARGAAKALLDEIIRRADAAGLPLRLVSSACNLDSFSLYSRAGFVPVRIFQDMIFTVPENGMDPASRPRSGNKVRPATADDVGAMVALEEEIAGIRREKDFRFFVGNRQGIWSTLVAEDEKGLAGFLTSIAHPGARMIGPGVSRNAETALSLIWSQLDHHHRGECPVWLVPCDASEVVHACYRWGARNSELHLSQVRGLPTAHRGLVFPTFMPETA